MASVVNIIINFLVLAFLIASAIFAFRGYGVLRANSGSIPALESAEKYLIAAGLVSTLGAFFALVIVIVYLVKGSQSGGKYSISKASLGLSITLLILILICGILSGIAAYQIHSTSQTSEDVKNAYWDAVIATIVAILSFAFIGFFIVFLEYHRGQVKEHAKKEKAAKSVTPASTSSVTPASSSIAFTTPATASSPVKTTEECTFC